MKAFALILALVVSTGAQALERRIQTCAAAGVGIESLAGKGRPFYNGRVMVYKVDQEEPVCCATGVAVVLPATDLGLQCVVIGGYSDIDVARAVSSYDASRGLLLELPYKNYDGEGRDLPWRTLKLRVNLATSKVRVER